MKKNEKFGLMYEEAIALVCKPDILIADFFEILENNILLKQKILTSTIDIQMDKDLKLNIRIRIKDNNLRSGMLASAKFILPKINKKSNSETIPAKLIKPSNLNPKSKKIDKNIKYIGECL